RRGRGPDGQRHRAVRSGSGPVGTNYRRAVYCLKRLAGRNVQPSETSRRSKRPAYRATTGPYAALITKSPDATMIFRASKRLNRRVMANSPVESSNPVEGSPAESPILGQIDLASLGSEEWFRLLLETLPHMAFVIVPGARSA